MMMIPSAKASRLSHRGFTLVEIMVGMVVALLALLVIMQVFGSFEGQKRMTTGTADAQTTGALALQSIVRETQLAGYGIAAFDNRVNIFKCTNAENRTVRLGGFSTAPVWVQDSVDGGPNDEITVRYGTSMFGGLATQVDKNNYDSGTPAKLPVYSVVGCQVNDTAILSNGGDDCDLLTIKSIDADAEPRPTIEFETEEPASQFSTALINDNAYVSCIGDYRQVTFRIEGDRVMRGEEELASGVVNMQAQYGVSDSAGDSEIKSWVDATGVWSSLNEDRRRRIKAVRVAIVVRNPLKDREVVSYACDQPDDLDDPATGVCAWKDEEGSPAPEVDLTGIDDWDRYRYRVFETIIPLRNVVWAKGGVM